jgi:hypothetical protein
MAGLLRLSAFVLPVLGRRDPAAAAGTQLPAAAAGLARAQRA